MSKKKNNLVDNDVCPECGSANIINDEDSGEVICGSCGLVLRESTINDGKIIEVRALGAGEKTDFTLEGPYVTWLAVNKGEVDGANAIMTRQLQFKGNMSAIIRYSKSFLRLFQLMQQVPVEY